ncbi:MAG TPA: hypothetical protein VNC50_21955, partial [Planctomycetia bacterium]|nr:hypothetical protein [Planctomycetia bacterium]
MRTATLGLVFWAAASGLAGEGRKPKDDLELKFWLGNMIWHHRYTDAEMAAATGMRESEIASAATRLGISADSKPERKEDAPLLLLPYPGGRHPRIGFLDGAVDPQRETKVSVFTPWDPESYVVVDFPEAIWSNLGLTYLAHTHVPTIWTKRGDKLPPLEWERRRDGSLAVTRRLPNGVEFTAEATPMKDAV